jgi:Xaa-Pro aminopeptidase
MERDEAAASGLRLMNLEQYHIVKFLAEAQNNRIMAEAMQFRKILQDKGLDKSKIAIYGSFDAGRAYSVFTRLADITPGLTITVDGDGVIDMACATKDDAEIARIRAMGKVVEQVVGKTADFLSGHREKNNILIHPDGQPVTIGEIKNLINLWLAEEGAENPQDTIFSIGRDSGVPHTSGTADDVLRMGQTIVFDIFPCEAGGGYYFDFTRTWCLGYAPDETIKIYQDVYQVYDQVIKSIKFNSLFKDIQQLTLDLFEGMGHPTLRSHPKTQAGYVHSIGHGIGLHVHEKPFSQMMDANSDQLETGSVFTIEPGLYYPEREIGVRLENTYYFSKEDQLKVMSEYPMDLVIPISPENQRAISHDKK